MRDVNELRIAANAINLAVFDWPGAEPAVLFAHATGFHARCWDQVVARLPGRRCVAIDMRGHGRSDKPPPPYPWRLFAKDVAAVARALRLRGALGVGHSSGGYAVACAAALAPEAFRGLLLVDPVILPRPAYEGGLAAPSHFATRRRNEWSSPEEMFERFSGRAPFGPWEPAVLRDYCTFGLIPAPSGEGYVLACPPAIEAAVYAGNAESDPYPAIAAIEVPVRVLRAPPRGEWRPSVGAAPEANVAIDMRGSPTPPALSAAFRYGTDVLVEGATHYLPMETPALVANHVEEMLAF